MRAECNVAVRILSAPIKTRIRIRGPAATSGVEDILRYCTV